MNMPSCDCSMSSSCVSFVLWSASGTNWRGPSGRNCLFPLLAVQMP